MPAKTVFGSVLIVLLIVLVAAAPAPPEDLVLDLGGGVTLRLVLVPAGKFQMGSPAGEKDGSSLERPVHWVTHSKPFYMGATEVTRAQFARFVQETQYQTYAEKKGRGYAWTGSSQGPVKGASWRNPGYEQADDHPVVLVSWNDAKAFCEWLSQKSGRALRLPTEAEWEYSCRAGTTTSFFWEDDPKAGQGYANAGDATVKGKVPSGSQFDWSDGYFFTSPAGKFKPNAFGLYDMIGNASEWCEDHFGYYSEADQTDPAANQPGVPVMRDGDWMMGPNLCRASWRTMNDPDNPTATSGFRVCLPAVK